MFAQPALPSTIPKFCLQVLFSCRDGPTKKLRKTRINGNEIGEKHCWTKTDRKIIKKASDWMKEMRKEGIACSPAVEFVGGVRPS